jgi:putative transposase
VVTYGIHFLMGNVGACWDGTVVESSFGSLKHEQIFKVTQLTLVAYEVKY